MSALRCSGMLLAPVLLAVCLPGPAGVAGREDDERGEFERVGAGRLPAAVRDAAAKDGAVDPSFEKGELRDRKVFRATWTKDGKRVQVVYSRDGRVISRNDGVADATAKTARTGKAAPFKTDTAKTDVAKPDPAKPGPADGEPTATTTAKNTPLPAGAVSFSKDVQPILTAKCVSCHNARKRKADLDLQSSYTSVMEGVSAGKPDQSDVYLSLLGKGRKQMPPKSTLPAADVEKVRAWIAAGAPQN